MQWQVDSGYVPDTVRFRLPESVIDSALDKLKGGLAKEESIELDNGERTGDIYCFVVSIEKVGQFTREKLEAMKWLWNLQTSCRNDILCCTWLNGAVKPVVDDSIPPGLAFSNILESWPDAAWLNDNAMRAFAVFLGRYKNNVTVMIPPPTKDKKTKGRCLLHEKTLAEIASGVVSRPYVLLAVNFGGVHWGCLVVDRETELVKMYDSAVGKRNLKRLKKIATEMRTGPLRDEACSDVEVPGQKQTDSDSCGGGLCVAYSGLA
ncbi:hypothetical protein PHYPSEUDO_015332 [Phytophthora pseudosyringae]|uniref:Ubiquitin-like protease family profile domain-containing protein n=1 Tax=Phytophthora pseudosyringae TaxID=221518 RepID=A0A8T1W0K1_9STRA|nr:hypothetical protein PHYPSEUDO_015332 [Phytophthora pseudosyringae]